jgi:hypothetical protein
MALFSATRSGVWDRVGGSDKRHGLFDDLRMLVIGHGCPRLSFSILLVLRYVMKTDDIVRQRQATSDIRLLLLSTSENDEQ